MNRREFSQLLTVGVLEHALPRSQIQSRRLPNAFRFSVMLWALEKQAPLEKCIEMVAAAGYQGVELVGEFEKWSPEENRRIMARIRSLGLVVDSMSGVRAGFSDPKQSEQFMEQLAHQIMAATELGCRQIILLSGNRVDGLAPTVQNLTSVENLKRSSDLASKHEIEIVIEPIDPIENPAVYMTSVSDGFEIVREVSRSNVKVLYDFYHEQRAAGNLIEKLEKNVDLVGLVHIADVPGRHEPGTGEIDYVTIYRKLAQLRYGGYIAMEYYPTGDPVKSLRKSRLEALQAARTA
jgi:hydroxypyruvate isomerase